MHCSDSYATDSVKVVSLAINGAVEFPILNEIDIFFGVKSIDKLRATGFCD